MSSCFDLSPHFLCPHAAFRFSRIHLFPLQVFYYSDGVFKAANIPAQYTQYATLGIGTVNVIMTIISVSHAML